MQEQWRENNRADGLKVTLGADGNWLIVPPRETKQAILNLCPCCDRPFKGAANARLTADFVYPMRFHPLPAA